MVDLMAALALARKNADLSISGGNIGYSGNKLLRPSEINNLHRGASVATAECSVATVATRVAGVATVATEDVGVAIATVSQEDKQNQQFDAGVATVSTVATGISESREKVEHVHRADPHRCFICGIHETTEKPLLPVLSEDRGAHHWMHTGCWPEHVRRCAEARTAAAAE